MLATLVFAFLAGPAKPELAPGARYDARIPTLRQVVGHDTAELLFLNAVLLGPAY